MRKLKGSKEKVQEKDKACDYGEVENMNFIPAYAKACSEREVPIQIIVKIFCLIKDKPPEEQDAIREEWAKKIEETYPYKPGCDQESKQLRRELWKSGRIDEKNWLDKIDDLSDKEITAIIPYIHNHECYVWVVEDRKKRPDITDRMRLQEIRDKAVTFYDDVDLGRPPEC